MSNRFRSLSLNSDVRPRGGFRSNCLHNKNLRQQRGIQAEIKEFYVVASLELGPAVNPLDRKGLQSLALWTLTGSTWCDILGLREVIVSAGFCRTCLPSLFILAFQSDFDIYFSCIFWILSEFQANVRQWSTKIITSIITCHRHGYDVASQLN